MMLYCRRTNYGLELHAGVYIPTTVAAVEGWFSASLLSTISSSPVFPTSKVSLVTTRGFLPFCSLQLCSAHPPLLAHRGTQDLPHPTWTSPRVTRTPHQKQREPPTFWVLRKVMVSAKSRMMSQSCSHWIPCNLTGVKVRADTQSPRLWAAGMSHSPQPGGGPCCQERLSLWKQHTSRYYFQLLHKWQWDWEPCELGTASWDFCRHPTDTNPHPGKDQVRLWDGWVEKW